MPSSSSIPRSQGDRWVVRPKALKSAAERLAVGKPLARAIESTASIASGPLETGPNSETDDRSKRWLALGLAGMVYAVGIAGLWSMVSGFDQTAPLSLTPAGDDAPLPPLDEGTDMRDARLDDLTRPPIPVEEGNNVALSDLQQKI